MVPRADQEQAIRVRIPEPRPWSPESPYLYECTVTLTPHGPFRIDLAENLGGTTYAHLRAPTGEKLIVQTTQRLDPAGGGSVGLSFDAADAFFFDADSGQRLR